MLINLYRGDYTLPASNTTVQHHVFMDGTVYVTCGNTESWRVGSVCTFHCMQPSSCPDQLPRLPCCNLLGVPTCEPHSREGDHSTSLGVQILFSLEPDSHFFCPVEASEARRERKREFAVRASEKPSSQCCLE